MTIRAGSPAADRATYLAELRRLARADPERFAEEVLALLEHATTAETRAFWMTMRDIALKKLGRRHVLR